MASMTVILMPAYCHCEVKGEKIIYLRQAIDSTAAVKHQCLNQMT